ncbi:hypothetical protein H257_05630 [Aphanomyces astaci]|uniref:Uncharacterized protein n=1 Tax=Aphanomyces astaci TaxID=112090 RepID=W4GS28_APHAT|nr:hypothetical protein H257_05630 [Aphanomyces astaci]ETV82126.1 hypothetical protein H257_05630 [Aphanomyces astaci]|eukprot:XP_009828863.1 hypothetical protein H257_05630 [Aphanomyces astaci]
MKVNGDNAYKIPHMAKVKKSRQGSLPRNVVCPREVYDMARASLAGVDTAAVVRACASELEMAASLNELSFELECIALNSESSDDVMSVLNDIGIEPISIDE